MIIIATLVSFFATFGFCIAFNIRGKKIFFAALGGAISWFFYSLPLQLGATEITSLFISSAGRLDARRKDRLENAVSRARR